MKQFELGRSCKADLALHFTDVAISSVAFVGECCASDPSNSEAVLMRSRLGDIDGLGKLLFAGVDDPA